MDITMLIGDAVIGLTAGLVSGVLAFYFTRWIEFRRKPKLSISPQIALDKKSGNSQFSVKVLNTTGYELILPLAKLYASRRVGDGASQKTTLRRIQLISESPMRLPKKVKDHDSGTYIFRTHSNIDALSYLEGRTEIIFRIICEHPISRQQKLFEKRYALEDLQRGVFKTVDSFQIDSDLEAKNS